MDNHTLVIDIETVSSHKEFGMMPEEMQRLWRKKSLTIKNDNELSPEQLYFEKGAIYAEFGKIITIAFGIFHQDADKGWSLRVKAIANDDEKALLNEFKVLIEGKFDQQRLSFCAHNGREFDYPYISRRMLINGISLPETLKVQGKKPWEIKHVDTMEMWKFGDWKSYTSLELLTAIFNIPSSKEDIDGSMVNQVYYHENQLQKIAKYCCNDVVATAQLYLRLNGNPLIPKENITILF